MTPKAKNEPRFLEWATMTTRQIDALDRDHTVVIVTSSPLEAHGPHLPVITDIVASEGILERTAQRLRERHPEMVFVRLPPVYVAADVLPHHGSINFRQSTITRVFEDLGRSLCKQGFRRIWVGGFHGGPRHFVSVEAACERVNRKHGGQMISVFIDVLAGHCADALTEVWSGRRHVRDCHSPVWKVRWIFTSRHVSDVFERALRYRNRVW